MKKEKKNECKFKIPTKNDIFWYVKCCNWYKCVCASKYHKTKKMDSVFLNIILVPCSIASLVHALVLKESLDLINYSFIKRKIDDLSFESPSQLANYFYQKQWFCGYDRTEFALRMIVFTYNYFKIDELAEKDSSYTWIRTCFNESFDNSNELKKYIDVPSTIEIEPHVISYKRLQSLIWNLFGTSDAMHSYYHEFHKKAENEYFDLFDRKYKVQKYKL